jgi:hypothetical protein
MGGTGRMLALTAAQGMLQNDDPGKTLEQAFDEEFYRAWELRRALRKRSRPSQRSRCWADPRSAGRQDIIDSVGGSGWQLQPIRSQCRLCANAALGRLGG